MPASRRYRQSHFKDVAALLAAERAEQVTFGGKL